MTSAPVRDPLADHLITPQNAALLLIDYQPSQLACTARQPGSNPATAERERRFVHINVHLNRRTQA